MIGTKKKYDEQTHKKIFRFILPKFPFFLKSSELLKKLLYNSVEIDLKLMNRVSVR